MLEDPGLYNSNRTVREGIIILTRENFGTMSEIREGGKKIQVLPCYVWEMVQVKKLEVKLDKFFGFLTFKYKMHQATSSIQLKNLHYI